MSSLGDDFMDLSLYPEYKDFCYFEDFIDYTKTKCDKTLFIQEARKAAQLAELNAAGIDASKIMHLDSEVKRIGLLNTHDGTR